MQTGENEQALRKIIDFTRLLSIAILVVHYYLCCYPAFRQLKLTHPIVDHLLSPLSRMMVFKTVRAAKISALLLLIVSLAGSKGKRDEKIRHKTIVTYCLTGLLMYFLSSYIISLPWFYIGVTSIGYLLFMTGGGLLFRMLKLNLGGDIFNKENETFPQEERLLENEYSVNLPARYRLKSKERNSWINIINPFRGTLVGGSPGAGKSYFVIRHIITQHIQKGFSMLIYDFKYDDLSKIAYNALLKHGGRTFYAINFENIMHRSNPLE
ncbi:MAG TPA: YWFCY domain-containing protein, partial [Puia sp.]|nr:YWFCY domain-containing protein [Puia sp.]